MFGLCVSPRFERRMTLVAQLSDYSYTNDQTLTRSKITFAQKIVKRDKEYKKKEIKIKKGIRKHTSER